MSSSALDSTALGSTAVGSTALWLTRARADLPSNDAWLGGREAQVLARLTVAKRRGDWRLGRWVAKAVLRAYIESEQGRTPAAQRLEVLAADDGAPEAYWAEERLAVSLSLSHSEGVAFAVVGARTLSLGCDLEQIAERSSRFADDYFTAGERQWLETLPSERHTEGINLLWSAKEAALKALRVGLTRDTRELAVAGIDLNETPRSRAPSSRADAWRSLEVRDLRSGRRLGGRWMVVDQTVRVVVAAGRDCPLLAPVR